MNFTGWLKLTVAATALSCSVSAVAQINKQFVEQAPKEDQAPWPHLDPDDPDVIKLRDDPNRDMWRQKRDYSNDGRTPGPVSLSRYEAQMENVGVKTFFQQPFAWTQEDLIAGEVDIAFFGAPTGVLPHSHGSVWAPAEVRYTRDYGTYGATLPLGWVEYETLIDPFTILKAVDYGDAGMDPYSNSRTLEEIRVITREVAETGAIPFIIGGDHSVPNGSLRGIIDVYGKKNIGFLHFDAHLDRGKGKFGAFYHSGSYMTLAVNEGLLDGKDVVQFGMSTPVFGEADYQQIIEEGGTVFHLHEIRRDGIPKVFEKIYEIFKDKDLIYVSFDIDTFDMSYAPGTGSSSPTGVTPSDLFPHLREFAARKTIVGFDVVEYNPFYDNRGQQTARLVRRTMFQFLTGIAMKKKGLDPDWVNPVISGDP